MTRIMLTRSLYNRGPGLGLGVGGVLEGIDFPSVHTVALTTVLFESMIVIRTEVSYCK